MNDDEQVKIISSYLEKGGKMLAQHCGVCSSPLFQFEGGIVCPICIANQQTSAQEKQKGGESEDVQKESNQISQSGDAKDSRNIQNNKLLKKQDARPLNENIQLNLEQSLIYISERLSKEKDLESIERLLKLLENGVKIYSEII